MSLFSRIGNGRGPGPTSNPGNREVCKFYLEGRCKFGDSCRYYHPPRDQQTATSQARPGGSQQLPFHLNAEAIKADLTLGDEKPAWPLSCYGPGRDAPRQLLEGAIEQSPEELRVQYYLAQTSGTTSQYEQTERDGYNHSNQQAQRILADMDGAIKFVIDGKDVHPNREDVVTRGSASFSWRERPSFDLSATGTGGGTFGQSTTFGGGTGSTFGQTSAPATQQSTTFGGGTGSTFGQTSAPATQQTSTFGQPSTFGSGSAFGSNPQTAGSTFGQPSGAGAQTSAFGQPSNLGTQTSAFGARRNSAFGAPSALGSAGSAFGKPSPLGGGSTGGSAFGQASALGGNSPFGGGTQTAPSTQGTAFGQPSAPGVSSAFGKPTPLAAAASVGPWTFGQTSSFGGGNAQTSTAGSAFGQASASSQQQSTFGQSSAMGQPQSTFGQSSNMGQQQSAFGQPSSMGQQTSTFGQASAPGQQQSAFGKPSPFASSAGTGSSAFGQPSQPGNQSTFGSASTFGTAPATGSAFGTPSAPAQQASPFGSAQQPTSTPFGSAGSANPTTTSPFAQQQSQSQPQQPQPTAPSTTATTAPTAPPRAPGAPLTSWKNHPVSRDSNNLPFYNPTPGKPERIWHPDGPPGPNPDVEAPAEVYDDAALVKVLKEVYEYVRETGRFKDGLVPEVPPRREWVGWEL